MAGELVDNLLLEDGSHLLLESSGVLLLEAQSVYPDEASGGWKFLGFYDSETQRRRALAKKRKKLEEETEEIQDGLDKAIALLLREQEAKDEKRDNLARLQELAQSDADLNAARAYSERVATAYARALTKGTYSALEALDRELDRARTEEEFLMEAVRLLVDD
jgi:hypothetical protein